MTFDDLRLSEPILRAVRAEGYKTPSPIQQKAIPPVLEGRDVLGCAQTGTGKTAAFALPILHRLTQDRPRNNRGPRNIRTLVLAPTRELAAQIGDSFRAYGRNTTMRHAVIFGGVNQNPQTRALREGVDILVATPGRLLDLMNQGYVDLRHVEVLVLDEADRMLDMGFIRDIRKIVAKVPTQRQTLFFSATMPPDIRELADAILHQPVYVQVAAVSSPVEAIGQSVYFVEKRNKPAMLEYFFNNNAIGRALVFTRTKHGADRVARDLSKAGIPAEAIHGNKSQNARVRAMEKFKSSAPPVLVATDIAARGLDIDEISHVINYDLPNEPETYVHRIGRTGRAGASGLAVSFCDSQERPLLGDIERLIRRSIPVNGEKPRLPAPVRRSAERPMRQGQERRSHSNGGSRTSGRPQRHESERRNQNGTAVIEERPQTTLSTQQMPSVDESRPRPVGIGYRSRGRSSSKRGMVLKKR